MSLPKAYYKLMQQLGDSWNPDRFLKIKQKTQQTCAMKLSGLLEHEREPEDYYTREI